MKKSILLLTLVVLISAGCNQAETNSSNQKNELSFEKQARGCGNFFVYVTSSDRTKVLIIEGSKEKLSLGTNPKTFDLENNKDLEIYIDDYKTAENYEIGPSVWYCDDIMKTERVEPDKIPAISGNVTLSYPSNNQINVSLKDIEFGDGTDALYIKNVNYRDIVVNFYPG